MNERLVKSLKIFGWFSSSVGACVAVAGSAVFWVSQRTISDSVWPMPALVLIDWALLGVLSWLGTIKGGESAPQTWGDLAWLCAGGLAPLVILGGFSIGPLVLVSLVPLLLGALTASLVARASVLRGLGILLIGAVCNLGLVFIFITIGHD